MDLKEQAVDGFIKYYDTMPTVVSFAPGRLEILGNHTDYNEGYVLSTAVNLGTYFVAREVDGDTCRVHDLRDKSVREFSISNLLEKESGDWANYVKGVLVELDKRGFKSPAFDATILSDIPLSAGMSSSAALEIAVAYGVGQLIENSSDSAIFAELTYKDWALIGQGAENNYVGANTGLMDQFTSINGQVSNLVFSDFRTLDVCTIPIPENVTMIVANTMVKHNLTEDYNIRRASCEEVAAAFNKNDSSITHLRDITSADLESKEGEISAESLKRARHVTEENERVLCGVGLLMIGNVPAFGKLMTASQHSSRYNFENSCEELDTMVEIGMSLPGYIGARLSGGGFGGITVHFVEKEFAADYAKTLASRYHAKVGKEIEPIICTSGSGAYVGCP